MSNIHRLYVSLLLLSGAAQLVHKALTETGGFSSRYLPLIVAVVLATGFIGHIRQRPLLKAWCWKVVFGVSVLASACIVAGLLYFILTAAGSMYLVAGIAFFVLVLVIPAQVAIYRYAYKSRGVWHITADKISRD